MPNVLGVLASKLTKNQLLHEISKKIEPNSRLSLYFLYSEFVLRANRLPAYKEVLNQATWNAVDGRGLAWSIWSLNGTNWLAWLYAKIVDLSFVLAKKSPKSLHFILDFIRLLLFLSLFSLNLIVNLIIGFITIAGKYKFIHRTHIETILGRDFVWDILQLAHDKKMKVAVVGGSKEGDEMTKHLIHNLFKDVELVTWVKPRASNLISDVPKDTNSVKFLENFFPWILLKNIIEIILSKIFSNNRFKAFNQDRDIFENLNTDNVCDLYPDLYDAKDFLRKEKADLILLCLGGGSGKQEFFAQVIKQDLSIDFGLVTGLGAAIDYLDGDKAKPPKWVCQMGLEWVFRLIYQPYRRLRIIDDIFTLWWWTSLQQFLDYLELRETVLVQVENDRNEILLAKRRSILPGDVGWVYIQGGVEEGESLVESAKREVWEEAGLEVENLEFVSVEEDFAEEIYPVSFWRTVLHLGKYQGSKTSIVKLKYTGKTTPKANWENQEVKWIANHRVLGYLSQEKRVYYKQ